MTTSDAKTSPSEPSVTLALTAFWILFSTWCVITGQVLSFFGLLGRTGYIVAFILGAPLFIWPLWNLWNSPTRSAHFNWTSFKSPFAILYLSCLALVFIGGLIHPPTNYDAFCYRIPRMLQWLEMGKYHWIGGFCPRMDFSSLGFEWLMLPGLAIFKTLRLAFLINVFSYLLMPGLIYSTFRGLGIRNSVAGTWMWIIPCGSCFAMEAGSIGNDFTATIYLLAAITFAIQSRNTGKPFPLVLALLSGALLTCAKASNLPLLLPVAICILAALARHPKLIIPSIATSIFGLAVSFVPLAIVNANHTGSWTGSPNSIQNLKNPVSGLVGNSLQLGTAALVPAVFPLAPAWNKWISGEPMQARLVTLKKDFPEINFKLVEMASEEGSGIGLGVSASLILAILAAFRRYRAPDVRQFEFWVAISFWISLLTVMAKLGNPSVPRIVACYYPGLIVLPLILFDTARVTSSRIWQTSATILLIPIIPALLFSPARPMIRLDRVVALLGNNSATTPLVKRLNVVYDVYSKRSDEHAAVRNLLPTSAKTIGFAGTDGDSQYSFWLPLEERQVRDFTPQAGKKLPSPQGLDAIVTSDWGSDDRFGITPEQMALALDWKILASVPIRRMASFGEMRWCVLVPKEASSTDEPDPAVK